MGGKQQGETIKEQPAAKINPEYEALLPKLSAEEYEALKSSIKDEGLFVPITVNKEGIILDGHHRYKACMESGIDPEYEVKSFPDHDAEMAFVIQVNIARRQLSNEQKRELALVLRQNQWSQEEVASLLKVTQRTIGNWESIINNSKITNTCNPLDLRYSIPKEAKQKIYELHSQGKTQQAIADEYKIGQPRVSQIVRQIEARNRSPESLNVAPLPNKQYNCIVIDPPWPVKKIERENRPDQGSELDYRTMSLQEIANLPILNLTNPAGSHVYLWVTSKFLPVALQLFNKWGIKYQCVLAWVKNVGITPFSFMYNLEFVVFGRVGNLPLLECGVKQSFEGSEGIKGANGKHSEKPESFYDLVLKVSPGPRLDMFARKNREGFDAWGNEVEPSN